MVATEITLGIGDDKILEFFDKTLYMAFGDDNSDFIASDTALGNELYRVKIINKTKDEVNNLYYLDGVVPLSQLNSNTIFEIGVFDESSGGNMFFRLILESGITKTDDDEFFFKLKIEGETINN